MLRYLFVITLSAMLVFALCLSSCGDPESTKTTTYRAMDLIGAMPGLDTAGLRIGVDIALYEKFDGSRSKAARHNAPIVDCIFLDPTPSSGEPGQIARRIQTHLDGCAKRYEGVLDSLEKGPLPMWALQCYDVTRGRFGLSKGRVRSYLVERKHFMGRRPEAHLEAYNYDTKTGRRLLFEDIFIPGAADSISLALRRGLEMQMGPLRDNVKPGDYFFIEPDGIRFLFGGGSIDPGFQEELSVLLGWDKILPYVDSKRSGFR